MRMPGLSPRQTEVLALILLGKGYAEIAAELGITPGVVKSYANTACKLLGLRGDQKFGPGGFHGDRQRPALILLGVKHGWLISDGGELRVTFPYVIRRGSQQHTPGKEVSNAA